MGRTARARIPALLALVAAVAVVGWLLLRDGEPYRISATFLNASQLVKGNEVKIAGERVGTVADIELTRDGRARLSLEIEPEHAPLREGTRALIRQTSLSGVANRYVALQLAPQNRKPIADGGLITSEFTQSAVDLDALFNTFDPKTRKAMGQTIRFLRDLTRGNEREANEVLGLLNPALASQAKLFRALDDGDTSFEEFITEVGKLVTDLSARDEELTGSIRNIGDTMAAVADRRTDLDEALRRAPDTLRRANSTFVDLRSTLDSLDPLLEDARPVLRRDLRPLFAELRPFARDAATTSEDLARTVRRPGADNDLVELLRRQPAVDQIATRTAQRTGGTRLGALPESRRAFRGATPQLATIRPYTPEFVGWFDDFSSSGAYDALGGFSRAGLQLNAFTVNDTLDLLPVPPELRDELDSSLNQAGRNNRCPGSLERGGIYRETPDFPCDPRQVPIGP